MSTPVFIKVEVVEGDKFNTLYVTARDDSAESLKQLDLILHAIMSQQPKRGGQVMGKPQMKIDVLKADIVSEVKGEL